MPAINSGTSAQLLQSAFVILGMPGCFRSGEKPIFNRNLVQELRAILRPPGHKIEFLFARHLQAISPWRPIDASHNHQNSRAWVIVTTYLGQETADRHHAIVQGLLRRLEDRVLLHPVEPATLGGHAPEKHKIDVELISSSAAAAGQFDFDQVAGKLGGKLPWLMRLTLESGADLAVQHVLRQTRLKRWGRALTGKQFTEAYEQGLLDLIGEGNDQLIRCSLSVQTWGNSAGSASRNESIIQSHLAPTPLAIIADAGVVDLEQVAVLLPITQPVSPWSIGGEAAPFLTVEGEIFPYQPGSRQQSSVTELVVDPSGALADDYHAAINHALCKSPIPVTQMVTITFDRTRAEGCFREVPAGTRCGTMTFSLEQAQALNILESPLGFQHATEEVKSDLARMLAFLCEDELSAMAWPNSSIGAYFAEQAYSHFSLKNCPKPYFQGVDLQVDGAIDLLGRAAPSTWWEVSEQLMLLGFPDEALRAHQQAVPTLSDLPKLILTNSLLGAPLTDKLASRLTQVISQCPALGSATRLNLRGISMLTLNIDPTVEIDGLPTEAVMGIQFLLARRIATEEMFVTLERIPPGVFREHYNALIEQRARSRKKITYTNLERAFECKELYYVVQADLRVARMHHVLLSLETRTYDEQIALLMENVVTTAIFRPELLNDQGRAVLDVLGFSYDKVMQHHSWEARGFIFSAHMESAPYRVSQYLMLPDSTQGLVA
ncbi:hypothetical protein RBE51_18195 [Pseudomonas taiwanensis]|uniref:hypothetical protein n=1 Tax=Pseudomonas taiwanensis TaxID=470150 RepID=UPI0028DDC950|nr:hypothetical protein [Pseudomonas taiwanensis]MDT8924727.1 hypothetical protein [Pseudomonas taiwanensis]